MGCANLPLRALLLPLLIGLPVAAGVLATMFAAAGIVPGLSGGPSLDGVMALWAWPGLAASVALTVRTGLAATLLATLSALALAASPCRLVRIAAAPMLAAPHAAVAIGVGFLIAPTGFLVRLLGLAPMPFATVGDHLGAAIVLALWLKETPFLLLMALSGLGQTDLAPTLRAGAALGQSPRRTWLAGVLPRLWPQLRLPVLAVFAFSLSVTDVAVVLGPQTPPTLAVAVLRWSLAPDLSRLPLAACGALLLTALVLAVFGGLRLVEMLAARVGRAWIRGGGAAGPNPACAIAALFLLLAAGVAAVLIGWAGADSWRFPARLPQGWPSAAGLSRLDLRAAAATLSLGFGAVAVSLPVAILVRKNAIVWWPLLLPQAGFLFGVQILAVAAGLDGSWLAVLWAHILFVLPYMVLALRGPLAALDPRYARVAAGLGATRARVLWRVTLPLLAAPLAAAAAVGFAVSAGQYLPTLFLGAGRIATLATEAVSLSAGADRRVLAATALAQAALPCLGFAVALLVRPRR